ncbi:MAG TPA: biotin--[acetyl-CoA-carboxylase] ligase [Pyrinomonadaceae bacterium]|jgi:BirA family biotin operon repressor/biotin-[acetyl-CoA-carboxylase] ligase
MNQPFRPVILRFDALASTNTEAARQAMSGAPEGLCVVAREQTRGRGRHDRVWVSPPDAGLYFSIVLRPAPLALRAWPLITLMAALAVSDALLEAHGLRTDIKWPNDIIARERKLCGILAETVETQTGRAVVLGIGINLNDGAFPPELKAVATSVAALTGSKPETERLLQSLTRAVQRRYTALCGAGGEAETVREWCLRSSYAAGRRVRAALDGESIEGWTRGLEPDGALRVETDAGEIRIIRAGDITSLRASRRKRTKEAQ